MGNCCSNTPSPDLSHYGRGNFSSPGRVLGATPEQPTRAAVPKGQKQQQKQQQQPPPESTSEPSPSEPPPPNPVAEEARRRAAAAAEARATANKPVGKLADHLHQQKKQSRSETLKDFSVGQLRQREIDATNEAMSHN